MTTSTTKPKAAAKTAQVEDTPTAHLQEALRDLDKARQAAQGDLRAQLDEAYDRVRDAATDLRDRAGDDLREWEDSLERASEHLRVELGLRAIRAQRSTDALTQMSSEIRKRKAQLAA